MLYNNQNKYTAALLVPNAESLLRWAKARNISLTGTEGTEAVLKEIESVINQYKQGGEYDDLFPARWLPDAIAILDEPFSSENKLLNSLGKLVRAKVVEKHKDKIDFLYTPEGKNIINQENIAAIKRLLEVKS